MEEQSNKNINTNNKQIANAIIIAGIIIAGAILLKGNEAPSGSPTSPNNKINLINTEARAVSADDHILGNPNAPILIIEYSDTECPFCKVFHNTLHSVVENSDDKVAWVYRHYPIQELHPKAFNEAVASECAWEQSGNENFWKYIDEIFRRTESNNRLNESELPKIASDIGLDLNAFNSCLLSSKYATKVQTDIDDSRKAGASGTPFSLIVTKKTITAKIQAEIIATINAPGAVSFDSEKKNVMSMNGALPLEMVNKILAILLK